MITYHSPCPVANGVAMAVWDSLLSIGERSLTEENFEEFCGAILERNILTVWLDPYRDAPVATVDKMTRELVFTDLRDLIGIKFEAEVRKEIGDGTVKLRNADDAKIAMQLAAMAKSMQYVRLSGWGNGYVEMLGNDPLDVMTWFMVSDEIRRPMEGQTIHPAQIAKIIEGRRPEQATIIRTKKYRVTGQLVDYRSGEIILYAGCEETVETFARAFYLRDEFEGIDYFDQEFAEAFEEVIP